MEDWTEKEWKLVGECLVRGIVPGSTIKDVFSGEHGLVAPIDGWILDYNNCGQVFCGGSLMGRGSSDNYATVIKPLGASEPPDLSGKEVSVTIDGKTYTAIIK